MSTKYLTPEDKVSFVEIQFADFDPPRKLMGGQLAYGSCRGVSDKKIVIAPFPVLEPLTVEVKTRISDELMAALSAHESVAAVEMVEGSGNN